jgi:hypothetical protein
MNYGKNFVFGFLAVASSLLVSDPARANENSFRNFMALNPGIDKSALRQVWQQRDGGSSIGFGTIMPNMGRSGELPPVVKVIAPPVVSDQVSFRDFKNMNPGIDNAALRQVWSGDPTRLTFGTIRTKSPGMSTPDPVRPQISMRDLKNQNPGLDNAALKAIYRHLRNGDPADVTFGFVTEPPSSDGSSLPSLPASGSVLANQKAFGSINLLTDK